MAASTTPTSRLYQPLDHGKKEIRVLDLLPGLSRAPIACHMRTISLADDEHPPHYDALSYVWGVSTQHHTVKVSTADGDYDLPVTDNLHAALRNLRPRMSPSTMLGRRVLTIWIDAICINQQDNAEKSVQVGFMGQVYRRAICVRIWLGAARQWSLRNIREPMQNVAKLTEGTLWSLKSLMISQKDPPWRLRDFVLHQLRHRSIPKFVHPERRLFNNDTSPWSSRIWVIQEYCFAREVMLHFGQRSVLHELPIEMTAWDSAMMSLTTRLQAFQKLTKGWKQESTGVEYLFRVTSSAAATDPRDKVYALLGLLPQTFLSAIDLDYNLPVWAVYSRATFACMSVNESLHILENTSLENPFDPSQRTPSLPSWTIDFARESWHSRSHEYTRHIPRRYCVNDLPVLSGDLRRLTVAGGRFDTVRYSSSKLHCKGSRLRNAYAELCTTHRLSITALEEFAEKYDHEWEGWYGMIKVCMVHWRAVSQQLPDLGFPWPPDLVEDLHRSPAPPDADYLSQYTNSHISLDSVWCTTNNGYLGVAPPGCRVGDIVIYAAGSYFPLVLRQAESYWQFVGSAILDLPPAGFFNAFEDVPELIKKLALPVEEFTLI